MGMNCTAKRQIFWRNSDISPSSLWLSITLTNWAWNKLANKWNSGQFMDHKTIFSISKWKYANFKQVNDNRKLTKFTFIKTILTVYMISHHWYNWITIGFWILGLLVVYILEFRQSGTTWGVIIVFNCSSFFFSSVTFFHFLLNTLNYQFSSGQIYYIFNIAWLMLHRYWNQVSIEVFLPRTYLCSFSCALLWIRNKTADVNVWSQSSQI